MNLQTCKLLLLMTCVFFAGAWNLGDDTGTRRPGNQR